MNIVSMLGIKPKEANQVLKAMLLMFIVGALNCYISAFPVAIFLANYGSEYLPLTYLGAALFGFGIGLIFTYAEAHLPFAKLMKGLLFILGSVTSIMALLFMHDGQMFWIILILLWSMASFDLYDFCVWAVCNRIFTLSQGKRFFGLLSASQSTGGLAAGILSPLFLKFVSPTFLIFTIGVFALLAIGLIQWILPHHNSSAEHEEEVEDKGSSLKLLKNPLALQIFALIALSIFTMYTVDLIFNHQAEAYFPDGTALAAFLGIFWGVADGVKLFSSSVLFKVVLERLGLPVALKILPSVGLTLCLVILLVIKMNLAIGVLFGVIVTLKLLEENFRGTFTRIGHVLLIQPFPPHLRSILQSKSETMIAPVAVGLISGGLITYQWLFGDNTAGLCLLAMIIFTTSLYTLYKTKPNYILALRKAISNRDYLSPANAMVTREDLLLLKNSLGSEYPDEAVFALNSLLKLSPKHFKQVVNEQLESGHEDVKKFIIKQIEQQHWDEFAPSLLKLIQNPNIRPALKQKAILALSKINLKSLKPLLHDLLTSEEPRLVNSAAFVALKHLNDSSLAQLAVEQLKAMLQSKEPKHRIAIADIICDMEEHIDNYENQLNRILEDDNKHVRQTITQSLIRTSNSEHYHTILKNMEYLPFCLKTFTDIASLGPSIVALIDSRFDKEPETLQIRQLKLLQFVSSPESIEFLKKIATQPNSKHQRLALKLLSKTKQFEEEHRLTINVESVVDHETNILKTLISHYKLLPNIPLFTLLKSGLERKMHLCAERLLYALTLQEHNKNITKALDSFRYDKNSAEYGYAIELCESSLNNKDKKRISPLLSELYLNLHDEDTSKASTETIQSALNAIANFESEDRLDVLCTLAVVYITKQDHSYKLPPYTKIIHKAIQEAIEQPMIASQVS